MNTAELSFIALAGFLASLVSFKIAIHFAPKIGLVDNPGGRKTHEGAVPLIGGLVIIPIYTAMVFLADMPSLIPLAPLLGGVALLLFIGALDDKSHIHPWARFIIQIWIACYVVVFCHGSIENLGNLFGFGDVHLGWFAPFFSVTCLVLLMNAINMMDGLDGLCGGFLLAALGWLMVAAYSAGYIIPFWAMAFLVVPIIGFLVYNMRYPFRSKASVFLGDAGSLSLALILGWFAIKMAQDNNGVQAISPVVVIWIMSVPIIDTFAIFFVRMRQGRSPFEADRLHLHHKFIDHGIPVHFATILILFIAIFTGSVGYFGYKIGIPDYILLYSWSALWLGYAAFRLKYAKENTPKI